MSLRVLRRVFTYSLPPRAAQRIARSLPLLEVQKWAYPLDVAAHCTVEALGSILSCVLRGSTQALIEDISVVDAGHLSQFRAA